MHQPRLKGFNAGESFTLFTAIFLSAFPANQ